MSLILNPIAGDGQVTYPSSMVSPWVERNVDLCDNQDVATIISPELLATDTRLFETQAGRGTIIRARFRYDDGLTTPVAPIVKLFGRKKTADDSEVFQPIRNKSGDISVTLTISESTDVTDGTYQYTTPDLDAHSWDCDGFDEFLFGIETAHSAAAGTVTSNAIQVRVI